MIELINPAVRNEPGSTPAAFRQTPDSVIDTSGRRCFTFVLRGQHLTLTLRRVPMGEGVHLLIDGTGLSMVGEGELSMKPRQRKPLVAALGDEQHRTSFGRPRGPLRPARIGFEIAKPVE